MNLYLAVISWGYSNETQEAEWFHFVAKNYEYDEIVKRAKAYIVGEMDWDEADVEIDNVWINKVSEVDGYAIKPIKL